MLRNPPINLPLLLLLARPKRIHQRRVYQPRHHRIDPHAPRRIHDRARPRKLQHRRLRRRIRHLRLADIPDARDRRIIHDHPAASLPLHDRQHLATRQKHALQVQRDLRIPRGLVHAPRIPVRGRADVVDEHVDAAAQRGEGAAHDGRDVCCARRVGRHDVAARAGREAGRGALGGGEVDVAAEQADAVAGEQVGGCGAVAEGGGGRGPGLADADDEGGFVAEVGVGGEAAVG